VVGVGCEFYKNKNTEEMEKLEKVKINPLDLL